MTARRAPRWDELRELCHSDDALIARAALDGLVALAFYTEPLALLLRIEVEQLAEPGHERTGAFDVTLPDSDATLHETMLRELRLSRLNAKPYFDGIHGH